MIRMKKVKKIMILSILTSILISITSITLVSATITQYEGNYDGYDGTGAVIYIYYDTTYNFNNTIKVEYDMGKGPCIMTGLRLFYRSLFPTSGPHSTRIQFQGDTQSLSWLVSDLPNMESRDWHTLIYSGPTYLIDDDPDIVMIGMDIQAESFYVFMDPLGYNHSYKRSIFNGQWELEEDYEYMVEARYEEVDNLTLASSKTGSITSTDYVDAYFVDFTEDFQYNFSLDVTSGTGNLNMRLVSNQELTNDVLNSTTGSTNPEHMTYTAMTTGKHVLLVEPETASTDIADYSINFTENRSPHANFTANATTVLVNDPIEFTFTGDAGDTPSTYTWNFGDGSPTSSSQNPIHQYSAIDNYTVSLNVTDSEGEESIETKTDYITVEVDTSPTANFTANEISIMEGEFVQFTYTGTSGNHPLTCEWNFGDGSPTSSLQNPIHQYSTADNYTVILNVTDNDEDSDLEIKVDYIEVVQDLAPKANFTANSTLILVDSYVQFTFTGDPGDTPSTYTWDFGDGSPTSSLQNPIHQYTTANNYTVTLNVTDSDDETDLEIKTNYIVAETNTTPSAAFIASTNNIYIGEFVQFYYLGTGGNYPLTVEWDFGDGSPTSNDLNPIHEYSIAGKFNVSLTVTDRNGDYNTTKLIEYINVNSTNGNNGGIPGFDMGIILVISFLGILSFSYKYKKKK